MLLSSVSNRTIGSTRDEDLDLALSPESNWADDSDLLPGIREEEDTAPAVTPVHGSKRMSDHLSPPEFTDAKRADINRVHQQALALSSSNSCQ